MARAQRSSSYHSNNGYSTSAAPSQPTAIDSESQLRQRRERHRSGSYVTGQGRRQGDGGRESQGGEDYHQLDLGHQVETSSLTARQPMRENFTSGGDATSGV